MRDATRAVNETLPAGVAPLPILSNTMSYQAVSPVPFFTTPKGEPLTGGFVYFGEAKADPRENPVNVFYDAALRRPAEQPLRTKAGYLMLDGAPTTVWSNAPFSILVLDSAGFGVMYSAESGIPAPEIKSSEISLEGAIPPAASVFHWMTPEEIVDVRSDTGSLDVSDALQAAIASTPFGTLVFPAGSYRISRPLEIQTDARAGISRRDRHLVGYGAVIHCKGAGQATAFQYRCPALWPGNSFNLFTEGFVFDGHVEGAFISIAPADGFFENILFEKITTGNFANSRALFYFENGSVSNLGGVTIRRCAGGPNTHHFLELKGSRRYGQFDNFYIADNSHLGKSSFLLLNGATAQTVLQYSRIVRNFTAAVGNTGIDGVNQFITHSLISNLYAEPKRDAYISIACELIECTVENVVNTVNDFRGKRIQVHRSAGSRDTIFSHCRSYNGLEAPWERGVYPDIQIDTPLNIRIEGSMSRFMNNAVRFSVLTDGALKEGRVTFPDGTPRQIDSAGSFKLCTLDNYYDPSETEDKQLLDVDVVAWIQPAPSGTVLSLHLMTSDSHVTLCRTRIRTRQTMGALRITAVIQLTKAHAVPLHCLCVISGNVESMQLTEPASVPRPNAELRLACRGVSECIVQIKYLKIEKRSVIGPPLLLQG